VASCSFFFSCYFSSFHCTKKETNERKEGEEALVESQRKKEKKNLQFHSKGNICSNFLFVATTVAAQEPSLEHSAAQEPSLKRSFVRSRAQSASFAIHHGSSILMGPNLNLLLRARH
jgi:hypothetical protein